MRFKLFKRSAEDPGPDASSQKARSEQCGSAEALAEGFGFPVFVPTWWPDGASDVVDYELDELSSGVLYRIESRRADGSPLRIIGGRKNPEAQLATGDWHEHPEIARWHGLVRLDDDRFHAVIQRDQQTIHLMGFSSQADVVRAAESLRRVGAE